MQAQPHSQDRSGAEILLDRLAARLSRHALWDAVLLIVPPFGAAITLAVLFHPAWTDSRAIMVVLMAVAAATTLGTMFWYWRRIPSISVVARLADQQSGAKDHFLTLATLPSGNYPVSFISRLRRESTAFSDQIEIKRDFRYKIKRAAYGSIGASLLAVLLIYLVSPMVPDGSRGGPLEIRLRQLAQKMAMKPELKPMASQLEALAAKLEDPKASMQEKQRLTQEIEKRIEQQQKQEQTKDNQSLLGEAAGALEGAEQQVASAKQSQSEHQKSGGGIQSNVPQQGQGEGKNEGSGTTKGDSKAESNSNSQQGNTSNAKPSEPDQEKNRQQGETADRNQTDPNQVNKDTNKEQTGMTQGGAKEGAGKQQASDQPPPQGVPPADRLYPSGEGKQGLQGAGYITVQLPEEIAADGKSESRPSKDSRGSRSRSQVPVSNVPLPPQVPNAATEKQQIPLEYRGMIR
jgi:hypothetical protein